MDRRLVLNAQLAIARGHRVEVAERCDELGGEAAVLSVVDLDTGIRFRAADEPLGEIVHWLGRVIECTVVFGSGAHTLLTVDTDGDGRGAGARVALNGADAAAEAAKAEADRWGGGDRVPEPEAERFW